MPEPVAMKLKVNGVERHGQAEPRKLLVDFLREDLGLTGTHVGCEHGICGACTVLFNGEAVRSCLMFAVQAAGAEVRTVEGMAPDGELHPLQQAFRENYAVQCGFCTPGFLMAACDLLENNRDLSQAEIREALSGNLCRCTGYQSIVESVEAAMAKLRESDGGK
jgi:aerobic-type carbon monoxide dehydrogenase small subunit (CoxS/CutS family)